MKGLKGYRGKEKGDEISDWDSRRHYGEGREGIKKMGMRTKLGKPEGFNEQASTSP